MINLKEFNKFHNYVTFIIQVTIVQNLSTRTHYDIFYSTSQNLLLRHGVAGSDTSSGYNGEGYGTSLVTSIFVDERRIVISPIIDMVINQGIRITGVLFIY